MTSTEQTEAIRKTMEAEKQASRDELVRELVEALKGVVRVADRETDEFIRARAALRKAGAL